MKSNQVQVVIGYVIKECFLDTLDILCEVPTNGADANGFPKAETLGLAYSKATGLCIYRGSSDKKACAAIFPHTRSKVEVARILENLAKEIRQTFNQPAGGTGTLPPNQTDQD